MSAVERDSQVEMLGSETPSAERGITRSLSTHNGKASSPQRTSRLPALSGGRVAHPADVRRYLSERSLDLQSFTVPLEDSIRKAHRYRSRSYKGVVSAQAKIAELVLDTIRRIAHRETGIYNLEAPVPQLLSCLCAGSVEAGIVTGLVRRAQKALVARDELQRERSRVDADQQPHSRGLRYDVGRELDELTMLLTWYVRRKMSLAALEIDSGYGVSVVGATGSGIGEERDALFGLEVMHDHQVFGSKGCSVSCGLRLVGRDGQPLWLRVSVISDGKPVAVRPEWSSWTDPGDGASIELLGASAPFCSLVPIRANAQRLVIDEIRAFVPYAALQLAAGRQDVEIAVSVLDNDGHEIVSGLSMESICIAPREMSVSSVPAPHSVGMWPHDVVSGDKISEFSVSAGYTMLAGWEYHAISVQFDVSLFMHAGESVMLECRFVNSDGNIVELSSLGIPFIASEMNVAVESVSSYRYRRVLRPKSAWAVYQGLRIDIPVEFLLLDPGVHDITCELVIVSSDDRVLCGDMTRVSVHVPDKGSKRSAEDAGLGLQTSEDVARYGAADAAVKLESIDIDPAWLFAGQESIRIEALFSPRNTSTHLAELAAGRMGELFAPYRVELSLEREDGHVLLQAFTDRMGMSFKPVTKTVCVDGHAGLLNHRVVANFSKQEVLGWSLSNDSVRASSKVRLFARVTAITLDGEVIAAGHKEFFVRPPSSQGQVVAKAKQIAPTLVDLLASGSPQSGRISMQATINIPAGEYAEEGVSIKFFLCSPEGARIEIATKQVSTYSDGLWTRAIPGVTQTTVQCEYEPIGGLEKIERSIEAVLLSASDEVLDQVTRTVQTLGVLSEVEALQSEDSKGKADEDFSMSDAGSSEETGNFSKTERGFFRRLFS